MPVGLKRAERRKNGIEEDGKMQKWDCFDIRVGFSWNGLVFEKQKLIRSAIQQSTALATSVLSHSTFVPSRPYSSISSLSRNLRLLLLWLFMNFTSIIMVMNSVFWVIYELIMHIHITFPYGRILWSMMRSSSYNLASVWINCCVSCMATSNCSSSCNLRDLISIVCYTFLLKAFFLVYLLKASRSINKLSVFRSSRQQYKYL